MTIVDKMLEIDAISKISVETDELKINELFEAIIKNDAYSKDFNIKLEQEMFNHFIAQIPYYYAVFGVIINTSLADKDILYKQLSEYGFNFNNEIKFAIRNILTNEEINDICQFIGNINGGYNSITKITEANGTYTIIGKTDDEIYTFYRADQFFHNDKELVEFITKYSGNNKCHEYVENLYTFFPDGFSITANCTRFMDNNYYAHSYIEYDNMIIDLTLNLVMGKETYYKLMNPTELVKIPNRDFEKYKEYVQSLLCNDPGYEKIKSYYFMLKFAYLNQLGMLTLEDFKRSKKAKIS